VLAGNGDRGHEHLRFEKQKRVLLVLGGSQGAREINRLLWGVLQKLLEEWNVVHQTGADGDGPAEAPGYRRYDFIRDEYPDILAAADLVLCRAGATTLWELAATKKPSILLPLGTGASRGDQIKNAELFEKFGASFLLDSGTGCDTRLLKLVKKVDAEPETLLSMGERAWSIFKPSGASAIAEELLKLSLGEELDEC
jgi:UDP-N-acetylglucosamine--N-acetylmuramyl-(pentapeptide) pyrophosphoryl-undecaprenol N-acetylglucosamine transferase